MCRHNAKVVVVVWETPKYICIVYLTLCSWLSEPKL